MIHVPEFSGSPQQWVVLLFLIGSPALFWTEAAGLSFGYSKFAKQEQRYSVPSRLGMFVIYFPATWLFPLVFTLRGGTWTTWHAVVCGLIVVHFSKRCLETLFVHKYSGVMNGWTMVMVCALYSLTSALLGDFAAVEVPVELAEDPTYTRWMGLGIAVWLVGTTINAVHHVLLARLRKPGETGYKLPTRGLFRWVACPHYLGEIVAWWGYAIVFRHAAAFAMTITMTLYLMGRSHNTVKWYRDRVEGVPARWKRLIPGVY